MPFIPISMGMKNPPSVKYNKFSWPVTFYDRVTFIGADSSVEFLGGRIVGDLMSANWDGGFDLTTVDTTATVGFYLDSDAGSMQLEGDLWLGGNLTLRDGGTISSGAALSGIVIDGTTANYRTLLFTAGWADGGIVATDDTIVLKTPAPSTDHVSSIIQLVAANDDTVTKGTATIWTDRFMLKDLLDPTYGQLFLDIDMDGAEFFAGGNSVVVINSTGIVRAHGSCYISTAAATTITSAGTFYKAAGTTTIGAGSSNIDFDMPANGRLRYTGALTKTFLVTATLTATTAGTNDILGFKLGRQNTPLLPEIHRFVGTGTDEGAVSVQQLISLATNQYVDLFVTNFSAAATVTINHMNLTAVEA